MKFSLTPQLTRLLESEGISARDLTLAVATDINEKGQYDQQWLVSDSSHVYVVDPAEKEPFQYSLPLAKAESFRTVAAVGSGFLQARVEGVWVNLIRFSNRLQFAFEQAGRTLEEIRKGQKLAPTFEAVDPQRCPNCGLMLEFPGELCPRCIDHGTALTRVSQMVKPYWRAALALTLLLLVGISLDLAWPLLTAFLVDYVLQDKPIPRQGFYAQFADLSASTLLEIIVVTLASVHIVRAFINFLTTRLAGRVGNNMTFDIRAQLVRKLEQLGLAYYNKQETGSLVGRVAYDTDAIQSFISQITSGFVMQFLMVIFSFMLMLKLDAQLAFWAVLPAPFVIAGAFAYWRYVHPRYQRYWDRTAKQAGLLNGILSGIRVVKAFAQEEYELQRFEKASDSVRGTKNSLDNVSAFFYPIMAIVFQAGGWIIWYVGGHEVLGGQTSLGTLMAFFGYLSMFYGPLGNLTNLTTWLTQFSTQMHRIMEILDAPAVLPEAKDPVPLPVAKGEVEFRDVSFSYSRGSPVLRNVNLKFRPGEKVGIVGRSGSGKTSIVNLIYRFYDVESGAILLDGVDIRSLSKDDLRNQISIVLQEPFLFQGTMADNIAYGRRTARAEEIIEVARGASAHDFIMHHPLAYDSPVGERGQELSGGERQRISIARAFLRDTPILVLDEATSAVDSESEQNIQSALAEFSRNRTTIIIAHRLSTLRICDRIHVIDNGEVAESGTHAELMARNGLYAGWVRMQGGESDEISATPDTEYETNWLSAAKTKFFRGRNRELCLEILDQGVIRGIYALRCFPIEHPFGYLSIRYTGDDGREVEAGILKNLADWLPEEQALIKETLSERYLFHRIERIKNVRKFSQFLSFSTETNLGDVEFVVRYDTDSVKNYGRRGRLLIDVEDNLYILPDLGELSTTERRAFERYVYW